MTFSFVAHIRRNWMRCNDASIVRWCYRHFGIGRLDFWIGRRDARRARSLQKINLRSGLNAAGTAMWPAPRKLKAASFAWSCLLVGPTLPGWAIKQVGSYLGYTGRDADVVVTAARDPL